MIIMNNFNSRFPFDANDLLKYQINYFIPKTINTKIKFKLKEINVLICRKNSKCPFSSQR